MDRSLDVMVFLPRRVMQGFPPLFSAPVQVMHRIGGPEMRFEAAGPGVESLTVSKGPGFVGAMMQ